MAKFTVKVVTKNYWTVEVEADDEHMAEEEAHDICQTELTSVSEKLKFPTLKYKDSEWEFYPSLTKESNDD
tara:strand:- start:287 stop:499 length:213 start_codon:yes stop_codon:yes gene_type:complete